MKKHYVYEEDRGPQEGIHFIDKQTYERLLDCGSTRVTRYYTYRIEDIKTLIRASRKALKLLKDLAEDSEEVRVVRELQSALED